MPESWTSERELSFRKDDAGEYGEAFAIRCNSEVTLNVFHVTDIYFTLEVDENGQLKGTEHNILKAEDCTTWGPDNFVWDITHYFSENPTDNK